MVTLNFEAPRPPVVVPSDMEHLGSLCWRTRDGQEMNWSQMRVSHLRNAARLLENRGAAAIGAELDAAWGCLCWVQGEQAEYDIERGIDHLEDQLATVLAFAAQMKTYADWRERVGWL